MTANLATTPGLARIAAAPGYLSEAVIGACEERGWRVYRVRAPEDVSGTHFDVLLIGPGLLQAGDIQRWAVAAGDAALAAERGCGLDWLPEISPDWPETALTSILGLMVEQARLRRLAREDRRVAEMHREHVMQLSHVGLALSTQGDHDLLLRNILTEARRLAVCDAASLFLLEKDDSGKPKLICKLAQNESVDFPVEEFQLPLDVNSIAGYVTLTGKELNVTDPYLLDRNVPYCFNQTFDQRFGYRTVSVLAIPLRTQKGEIVGGIEFINRKRAKEIRLTDPERAVAEVLPFTEDIAVVLRALSSQAAISIVNNRLLTDIEDMFEGFVEAAVTAIEQRDPTTSGHSSRVATLTNGLIDALPRSGLARFRDHVLTERQRKEVRYAALLHDFGKVGVREHVLLKSHKLSGHKFLEVTHRIALEEERLKQHALQRQLQAGDAAARANIEQELEARLQRLDLFRHLLATTNQPSVHACEPHPGLDDIVGYDSPCAGGEHLPLLRAEEREALSIRRGSLTPEERQEVESHVTYTFEFLKRIPWPDDLAAIPEIAAAHHEKLDGSGYPFRLRADEIPFPSRVMAVADIYDALTAADRPYKRAIAHEHALDVLQDEAARGLIDTDMVSVFLEAQIWQLTTEA